MILVLRFSIGNHAHGKIPMHGSRIVLKWINLNFFYEKSKKRFEAKGPTLIMYLHLNDASHRKELICIHHRILQLSQHQHHLRHSN